MMQTDRFSKYQSWFESEMECANGVRKRKQLVFWKTIGILLAVFVSILLICFVVDMASDEEILAMAVALVAVFYPIIVLITLFCMLPGFFKGRYARKIDKAIERQGFNDAQRERFAQEQMAVRNDLSKSVSLVITDGQDHMPAQFTLSEHYACFTGGTGFGPYIIEVDGTEAIRVTTNTMTLPALTRAAFLIIKVDYSTTTHTIQFIGHGKEQGRLQFGDTAVCEKVLHILRQRFPEAAGR